MSRKPLSRTLAMLLLAGLVSVAAPLPRSASSAEDDAAAAQKRMQAKLDHARTVLRGLAEEDFDAVAKGATELDLLTIEQWAQNETPAYRTQLKFFRFANEELLRLAKEENLDGATLAYTQLVMSCVQCHQHLRVGAR